MARSHIDAAIKEAGETGYRSDEVARAVFAEVLRIWRDTRKPEEIAQELIAAADNVDPKKDYTFMRP